MEAILVKVFATALALAQVTTRPDTIKTSFDPVQDRAEVVQLLTDGCGHMKKAFDVEQLDLDGLIETAMTDTRGGNEEVAAFRGIKFADLFVAYRQFCKGEKVDRQVVDIGQVIEFFNVAVAGLPDHNKLKTLSMPGLTSVLDVKGVPYAELYEPNNRRLWVKLADIPEHVQQAFVAAEDKRFFKHRGIDERSVIRAFLGNIADPKSRQGGSTITQQVAKNLLVGNDVSYERKIREMIVASRIEKDLSKQEILEIYLNAIFLGRSSWGIELAAKAYFGKTAKDLTLPEGAFLAGLAKGPSYYNPDRQRTRAQERLAYVLGRMQEDGVITEAQLKDATAAKLNIAALSRQRRDNGYHIVDQIGREAKAVAGLESLTDKSYSVRSTIHPQLQRAAETALQDGLARYEQNTGRTAFRGAEANLEAAIKKLQADPATDRTKPAWQQALIELRLPLYDVHWTPAVVVEKVNLRGGHESIRVGLRDGRVFPLSTYSASARRQLTVNDVIYVSVAEGRVRQTKKGQVQDGTRVDMRIRPTVQGAVVVLENKTGRILAMAGGFSYPLSQLNRATRSRRQPGSSFKPVVYLAALSAGLQPNTLVQDAPITLPPIGYRSSVYRETTDYKDWWSPKNYDGGYSGTMTLRRALEQSKNLVTAHLLDGGIAASAPESLDKVCAVAKEAQLYQICERYYPFVLGAQPVRPLDMAVFYASIANEGFRATPHVIESIERNGETVYRAQPKLIPLAGVDRPAAFQLRTIQQGVLSRGTARSIGGLSAYVGGKTGTSDDENDAWFVGFSNDVTIAVWVGYDNNRGKRTLGGGQTGGKVAVPIFEPVMQAVWNHYAPKTALRGPSPEASKQLIALPIDLHSGARMDGSNRGYSGSDNIYYGERPFYNERTANAGNSGRFMEYFRLDANGRMVDSQHRVISREGSYTVSHGGDWQDNRWQDNRSPFEQFFGIFRQDRPHYIAPQDYRGDPRFRESYREDPRYPDPRYQDPRFREDPRYRNDPRYMAPPGYSPPGGPYGGAPPPADYSTGRRQQQHRVY
jgi:penicillin-binding protein 1A